MLMLFRRYFIGPGEIFVIFQEIGIFSLRFKSTKVDKGYLCITLHLLNGNNSETFKNGGFFVWKKDTWKTEIQFGMFCYIINLLYICIGYFYLITAINRSLKSCFSFILFNFLHGFLNSFIHSLLLQNLFSLFPFFVFSVI